jgi:NAD(P)-dependent dehydrogenase (short-subunit alcohol dehydrogenase family)
MRETGGGALVHVSSISALQGWAANPEYTAAKGGIAPLARAVLREYGRENIRINTIFPGAVDTPFLRDVLDISAPEVEEGLKAGSLAGRFGHPDEVGYAIRWLLSDEASFVNGASLTVDGGDTTS